MNTYDPSRLEPRWQKAWAEADAFRAKNPGDGDFDPEQPKYYVLDMFPYPSGSGLHVGHAVGYVATDVIARKKRMEGANVLHPMGWDAFGLPAEQYAIQTGQHPRETTAENTANFRRQLEAIGLSFDWQREINTSHPRYYRWTQWIFKRLFERGLAYQTEVPVWWCEELKTVLANEEVINGRSERGNHPCVRRPLKQWMLAITAYADRLLEDLEDLDWPESVKTMQREWIGRSEGAEIEFPVEGLEDERIVVFTTRPDTLWGATFVVVAPEHPLLGKLVSESDREAVEAYVAEAASKSDRDRTDESREKTGVFTGSYARNPLADPEDELARVPIFVADYVLGSYGTGAIMSVPAHDERDHEFARRFNLEIRRVVEPPADAGVESEECFVGEGVAVHSGPIDGLATAEAKERTIALLEEREVGRAKVTYRLRDWLFSRQRYWGEPFPLLHLEDGTTVAVGDDALPVELPEMEDFTPSEDGSPPLARAEDWVRTETPEGTPAQRDTDTMPGWAGSCWYWLRFMDPENDGAPVSPECERYWGPVDLYVGGAAHAVLHLLYGRFWHKVLYDVGVVSTKEPFQKLFNQGMITALAYEDATGRLVPADEIEERGNERFHKESGQKVTQIVTKMAKSLKNVVNPDDIIAEYGADTLRLYELFMGPLADSKPWNPRDISGCRRFLDRAWRLYVDEEESAPVRATLAAGTGAPDAKEGDALLLEKAFQQALAKLDASIDAFNVNTGVAALMSFVNEATKRPAAFGRGLAERFALVLSPLAPHVAEELWSRLGKDGLAMLQPWPEVDERFLVDDTFELVVQVNGKLRARIEAPKGAARGELEELARGAAEEQLASADVAKVIVVPDRLVNFVVR